MNTDLFKKQLEEILLPVYTQPIAQNLINISDARLVASPSLLGFGVPLCGFNPSCHKFVCICTAFSIHCNGRSNCLCLLLITVPHSSASIYVCTCQLLK